ncbi:uncharacterized protein ARMOST_02685 [Armillaria ostoyae]|uniref:Uncharacterized protein n=1 Tax=Armillaria ostoyae TaxID=47428 RepID=A0A284QSD9_ARMOS|nr:uncharacterized protein ARMOST_02685 [Armillaria ostoyae]
MSTYNASDWISQGNLWKGTPPAEKAFGGAKIVFFIPYRTASTTDLWKKFIKCLKRWGQGLENVFGFDKPQGHRAGLRDYGFIYRFPNLPKITLSAFDEVGQAESSIAVLKQRSYSGKRPDILSALANTPWRYWLPNFAPN